MAQFNLQDYETVAQRLTRFLIDHPEARIITKNLTTPADRESLTWVVQTEIYLPMLEIFPDWAANDYPENNWYLKSTGLAFEIDGLNGMANKTSALENCETSSIGRALANCGYGGDKRTTREEMEKVERGIKPAKDWIALAKAATSKEELRDLYTKARRAGVTTPMLVEIAELADKWKNATGESS
jgi:hypothetical protein